MIVAIFGEAEHRKRKDFTTASLVLLFVSFLMLGYFSPSVTLRASRGGNPESRTRDMMDLDPSFNKVAFFAPIIESYITVDAGTAHVLAVPPYSRAEASRSLLSLVFPKIRSLRVTSRNVIPDPEQILLWRPDYIFGLRNIADSVGRIGFNRFIIIEYRSTELEKDLKKIWDIIGVISGKGQRAKTLMERFLNEMKELHALFLDQRPQRKPAPVLVIAGHNGHVFVWGKHNYLENLIDFAGGINSAHETAFYGPTNFEQILAYDPQYIIMVGLDQAATPRLLYEAPQWRVLRAVRERRVYLMPVHSIYNEPIDGPLLTLWLMEIFNPGIPNIIRDAYRETYKDVYSFNLSEDEIDGALFLKENIGSADYKRFSRPPESH